MRVPSSKSAAPGPDDQWALSVQRGNDELDRYVAAFRVFARELTA